MKRRKLRIRHIIIIVAACCISYTLVNQQIMIMNKRKEIANYNDQYNKIENENATLRDKIEFSKTLDYKEKMARERMGLIKPGETVYIFDQ